jgi:hypothetical protein
MIQLFTRPTSSPKCLSTPSLRLPSLGLPYLFLSLFCFIAHDRTIVAQEVPSSEAKNTALESSVIRIESVGDVIRRWKPNRHLYVKGELGIGEQQLANLQTWLNENGTHWTVVLMETAAGESYQAPDGRNYLGLDAVEYALGHGLSNQTSFGDLIHPQTREADGAVFALFLKERKFSYFASDAQDKRRLGEAIWVGQLDQPAFRAMRSGGRILDAVKDTVTNINHRLEKAIEAEAADEQRRQQERERAITNARSALQEGVNSIEQVVSAATAWKQQFPQATGALAQPPIESWKQTVNEISKLLEQEDVTTAIQQKGNLVTDIDRYLNLYAASQDFDTQIDKLQKQADMLRNSPNNVAEPGLIELETLVQQAADERKQGAFEFPVTLRTAFERWENVNKIVENEIQRLKQEAAQAQLIRTTIWGTVGFFVLLLGAVLFILNRRRAPLMNQANQELAKRQASVQKETDQIDQLFERNRVLLGSAERIVERGYTGRTQEVCLQALQYVDDLFIMSKEVRRVLADAKSLIEPNTIWGQALNLFSARRYQEAIHLVAGAPLTFYAETGIPRILQDLRKEASNQTVVVDTEAEDEVEATFEEVYKALDERGNAAKQRLDLFEASWTGIDQQLQNLQVALSDAIALERQLHALSLEDGYFEIPDFVQILVPALQRELAEADDMSTFDAVGAMEIAIPQLQRKMAEINGLSGHIDSTRKRVMPILQENGQKLQTLGYRTDWIDNELQRLTGVANVLVKQLVEKSIERELNDFADGIKGFENRAIFGSALANRIEREIFPGLTKMNESLEAARMTLARKLNLPLEKILEERERDPDDHAAQSLHDAASARSLLNEGEYSAAAAAVETAVKERTVAEGLVLASLESLDQFEDRFRECEVVRQDCVAKVSELRNTKLALSEKYQATAFRMEQTTEGEAIAGRNVDEVLNQVAADCEKMVRKLTESRQLLVAGRVLNGGDVLKQCQNRGELLTRQLAGMEMHLQKIEEVAAANQVQYQQYLQRCTSWASYQRDPLVTDKTLVELAKFQDVLGRLRDSVESAASIPLPSPFATMETLESLVQEIDKLEAMVVADRNSHAEAARAVAGAAKQLELAQASVKQSQADNVPDSERTSQINRSIGELGDILKELQGELKSPHGNWEKIDEKATQLQGEMIAATRDLRLEMEAGTKALEAFEQASRTVFQAEKWSGPWGLTISNSHGVQELERARYGLQIGNYSTVLELSRIAAMAAQAAIEQVEREARRRKMEADMAVEKRRRERERSSWSSSASSSLSSSASSFSSRSSSSSSSSSSSRSSGGSSGFSRSGW